MKVKLYTKSDIAKMLYSIIDAIDDPCLWCYPTVTEGSDCWEERGQTCSKYQQYESDCKKIYSVCSEYLNRL